MANLFPREPLSALTHGIGAILAVPGTIYLYRRSIGCRLAKRLSLVIFGLSLILCYAASTAFHVVNMRWFAIFDRLDRVGIFVLIAGTYTPLAWVLLRGGWRKATLTLVWSITAIASSLLAFGGPLSIAWMTGLYVGMGWGVIACYAELAKVVSHRDLFPLVLGGLLYSVGAVINVLHWPVIWPGVFGSHELFHVFVIGGSLAHYDLMLRLAIPFNFAANSSHSGRSGPLASRMIGQPRRDHVGSTP